VSYVEKELSVQGGSPLLLYLFAQGSSTWQLTNAAAEHSYSGKTWLPAAIECSEFIQTGELPRDSLSVTLPRTHSLAQTFIGYSPDALTSVTVFRKHADDPEAVVVWKGRVVGSSQTETQVTLECEPIFSSLRRIGLRDTYSLTCRHGLFLGGCRLQASAFATAVTVTAVNRTTITIPGAAALERLLGGTLEAPDGTKRMIVAHSGATVTIMRRVRSLETEMVAHPDGFSATVYPGCDLSEHTCDTVYHNLGNFGGWPGLPTLNPMGRNGIL